MGGQQKETSKPLTLKDQIRKHTLSKMKTKLDTDEADEDDEEDDDEDSDAENKKSKRAKES